MKGLVLIVAIMGMAMGARAQGVEVTHVPEEMRVDVTVDGAPFTSYIYTDTIAVLKKPVLYPVRSAAGTPITRFFPLEARAGERSDHPHQIGLWFNYGNVNGLDFWNNSSAIPPEREHMMGTIRHREVERIENEANRGTLVVRSEWVDHEGRKLLDERTEYIFRADNGFRAIDRITTLTAGDSTVDMSDNKEGVFGLRVRRELEMPAGAPLVLTDASGRPRSEEVLNDEGVNGSYRNSEGVSGYPDVWGKRARWTALTGEVDGSPLTIAMLDHPENVGYPTYWHARDYGLFAANPLGQRDLSEGKETLNFKLGPGEQTVFRHRLAIFDGEATDEEIEAEWVRFTE